MTSIVAADDNIPEIAMITSTVVLVALMAIIAFVAVGIYRARHSAAREQHYRQLAERAGDAQTRLVEHAGTTATALDGIREELHATRTELTEVKERLTNLERLLSQIG
ncbi:hypothetical protein ACLQ2S_03695 [Micromonospora sp. DT48]|uniref:hypothetical protein n=1 Tax=unclassified Micromonospora TaxID=2617518 RepID=UPI0012BD70F5|nr:hypothetical protein [Micromonospora sp. CP22]MTK01998.1 hypothetical protein [Micromonospora sp. CP22]